MFISLCMGVIWKITRTLLLCISNESQVPSKVSNISLISGYVIYGTHTNRSCLSLLYVGFIRKVSGTDTKSVIQQNINVISDYIFTDIMSTLLVTLTVLSFVCTAQGKYSMTRHHIYRCYILMLKVLLYYITCAEG